MLVLDFTYFTLSEQVVDDVDGDRASLRGRVTGDDPNLTEDERNKIIEFLEAFPNEDL